jgi:ComF family protein
MISNANALVEIVLKHSASYFKSLINLFFPRCCIVCGKPLVQGEEFLCTSCNINLPRTRYYLEKDNPIEKLFWGRTKLERACSFLYYYRGSDLRHVIYRFKYKGGNEVAEMMGRYMAAEMHDSNFFGGIDLLVPVPLHPKRLKERGYNQSEWLARGISAVTGITVETNALQRIKNVNTQTHKSSFERWENVKDIFVLQNPELIRNKHVLLIDDVLTTGATVLSCITALSKGDNVKISALTLAVAAQ